MKKSLYLMLPLLAAAPYAAAEELHYNIVEFNESASVSVANDTMNIVLVVRESAKNREAASNAVTRRFNRVLERIRSTPALEAELENRYVQPDYDDHTKITGYTDQARISVKSTDFAALGKLIADVQNDAMLDHTGFSVSPKKYAEAVEAASNQALKSFRTRAQNISQTMGFNGAYKIVKIQLNQSFETQNDSYQAEYAAPMAASLRAKAAPIMDTSPGVRQIRQTVHGSIQM